MSRVRDNRRILISGGGHRGKTRTSDGIRTSGATAAARAPSSSAFYSASPSQNSETGSRGRADTGGSLSPYSNVIMTSKDAGPLSPTFFASSNGHRREQDWDRLDDGADDDRYKTKETQPAGDDEPALLKRKDFLDIDEEAKNHPNRTYYYRKFQDVDRLIENTTARIMQSSQPGRLNTARRSNNQVDLKSYFLRGMAFVKKQEYRRAIADFTTVLTTDQHDIAAFYNRGMAYSKVRDGNLACISILDPLLSNNCSCAFCHRTTGRPNE